MRTTTKSLACGLATGIVVLTMLTEALAEFGRQPETITGLAQIGCSVFFVMIVGLWKLLGWLTGAAIAHLPWHQIAWHVVVMLGHAAARLSPLLSSPRKPE
jgi:hypothetical protein